MNDYLGTAMLASYANMGVQIDKFDNTDEGIILYFSVPRRSYHRNANDIEMSDNFLAARVKRTLEDMGVVFATCKYKTRDEEWTKEKAKAAEHMAYKNIGYKDW